MNRPAVEVPATPRDMSVSVHVGDHPREAPLYFSRLAVAEGAGRRYSVEAQLPGRNGAESLLPEDFTVEREHEWEAVTRTFAVRDDTAVLIERRTATTDVLVMAPTRQGAQDVLAEIRSRHRPMPDNDVHAFMWMMTSRGVNTIPRRLQTDPLERLLPNYPGQVARALCGLGQITAPSDDGRLLLWHGPPGTGKTNAALGLLHAWRSWCEADIVTDPERMFTDPSYLLEVLGRPTSREGWKLVVCEDADEYLRSDARSRSGPGLGRLLNATDGLLGRGSKAMVLLTTNDDAGRLHPAITRPGRCLSLPEFGAFSPAEASNWTGSPVTRPMTLAEMFALRAGRALEQHAPVRTGAYL